MDSRTCSILLNLDLDVSSKVVANNYYVSSELINKSAKDDGKKSYNNLRSTVKESFLTGSLKYGRNFIM